MLSCLRSITLRFSERMSVQYRIEMCYAYGGPQGTCCKLKTPLCPFPLLTSQFVSYLLSKRLVEYATFRVWKGIFGIRDLNKIRCGNRENDKYIAGIRDLTVPREAGLAKNWARDAGFMFACLSGMPETFKNTRKFKISIERINLHLTFISFCRN